MKYLARNTIAFAAKGETVPPGFESVAGLPVAILVGLTGVGKTTALKLLQQQLPLTLLPDRRLIADEIIIAGLQREDGEAPRAISDRVERFEYTARYRAKFSGGMAHALTHIVVNPIKLGGSLLLFDGLRGLEEIQYAATHFPQACFVVLDAPDMVRLTRLLKRGDAFDSAIVQVPLAQHNLISALQAVGNVEAIFSEEQLQQIARASRAAGISIDAVVEKMTIIIEERRNYDSTAARIYLTRKLPLKRVLVVDTAKYTAEKVAQTIADWLLPGSA